MASTSKLPALGSLLLLLILSACGGGKGSGVAPNGPIDPSSSYQGVRTKATLTQSNAENLIVNSYAGSRLAALSGLRMLKAGNPSPRGVDHEIRRLARVMKQSVRSMQLPALARERISEGRSRAVAARQGMAAKRAVVQQVAGPEGGTASYTLEVNDVTGSFYGTVTFNDYASDGVILSGPADMLGTFGVTVEDFSRMTLSFRSLTMRSASAGNTGAADPMTGSLSWASNATGTSQSETINLVVLENGKTYWWNNYQTVSSSGPTSQTQHISGRYYDPDYGYVDFITTTPVVAGLNDTWPSEGEMAYSGDGSSGGRLTFLPHSLDIQVDGDGDGYLEWRTQKATDELARVNAPPVAAAGPDQNVSLGALVTLTGSASSDADGDSLAYLWTFDSCPGNSCPELSSSTSAEPTFLPQREGDYTLQLTVSDGKIASAPDTVTVTASAAGSSTPDLVRMQWLYGTFDTIIGKGGLLAADLDGDGTAEIIAGSSPNDSMDDHVFYIVRKGDKGTYNQIWRSQYFYATLLSLTLADLTGDGKPEIVAIFADGTLLAYDRLTHRESRRLRLSGTVTAAAVVDLDRDGRNEVVTSDGVGIFVHSSETGTVKWSLPNCGGTSLAVGNVDGDASLEIVSAGYGGKGYVIDAGSRSVQWEHADGFGAQVRVADVDGNGREEIVAASPWYKITIFDAERKTQSWEVSTKLDIDAVLVCDTDGDGVPEILYGDKQSGGIHAVDVKKRAERWNIYNWDGGISGIAVADVDGDRAREVIFGAGGHSSGPDHLYVADPVTKKIKWQSQHLDGPLSQVAAGDVDGDGEDEIVMVSRQSDSHYEPGVVNIFNARTHAVKYNAVLPAQYSSPVKTVRVGDVDGDGKVEYLIGTGNGSAGIILVYDGATHNLKRESARYDGNLFSTLAIEDVDGDGKMEIIAGQGRDNTGTTGAYLVVLDGASLQEKWRTPDIAITPTDRSNYWEPAYEVKVADLDSDGHKEIIASLSGRLAVYDGVTHEMKQQLALPARALEVADIDGDGSVELLVGRNDSGIDVFDGRTLSLKKHVSISMYASIDGLRVRTRPGGGRGDWLVAGGGRITVLRGADQAFVARSEDFGIYLGLGNQMAVIDADRDGLEEVVVGSRWVLYHLALQRWAE